MPAPKGNTYAAGGPGGGRPSAYKQEYAKIAKSLCLLGATDKQMADAFGVSETTINNWKHQHEEFSCALKEGKLFADANVAQALYNRALGYEHEADDIKVVEGSIVITPTIKRYPPDATSAIFWLKNRQPEIWRDKPESNEDESDAGKPFNITFNVREPIDVEAMRESTKPKQ